VAGELGITDEEVGAVMGIVMLVSAGRVRAQTREARLEFLKEERAKKKQG
jgi:hypothetical protein